MIAVPPIWYVTPFIPPLISELFTCRNIHDFKNIGRKRKEESLIH